MRYIWKRRLVAFRRQFASTGTNSRNRSRFITGTVVAIISILFFFAFASIFGGGENVAKTAEVASEMSAEKTAKSSGKVIAFLVLTILICFFVVFFRTRRLSGAISDMAPVWGWVAGIIAANILFSGFFPEAYNWFRNESGFFWETVLGIIVVSALSTTFKGSWAPYLVGGIIALAWLTSIETGGWSWPSWGSEKRPSDRNLPYAGLVSRAGSAVKLPSPAWDYYDGPEKQAVMSAFPTDTTMWAIAACESRFRQFREDGAVLRGGVNPRDVGLFQINDSVHAVLIKNLMEEDPLLYNISTVDGNIEVAKILRDRDGYQPWNFSSFCWRDQLDRSPGATPRAPVSLASAPARRPYGVSLEIRDSIVVIPAGGWSEAVQVPFPYYLSNFTASRKDSLFMMSPSGKVYGFGPDQRARLEYEAGPWRFGTSDSASAEMEVAVSRRR